ncbi:hypothetical protein [Streptomyces violascens]|uniref:hypothetical protein n=1 Tax=Streptomyces violascens TaxID=67381 RepID=UPI0016748D79|nr:hypothetical protein [Streptomyces violascens]GGU52065.1 hypothetical protein GCM10010289_85440 [Streptomyces violascens]
MDDDLVAVCDVCLGEIADGGGVLEVNTAAADRALRAWRTRVGADPQALFHLTPGTRPVKWVVRHHDCDTGPVFAYTIAVERIRSWTGAMEWSVHLADKPFLAATDWFDLLDRALHPRRAAVSGILPRTPRDLSGGPVGDA